MQKPDTDPDSKEQIQAIQSPKQSARGWIMPLFQGVLIATTWPSEAILGSRRKIQQKPIDPAATKKRAVIVDTFVAACFVVLVLCYISTVHSVAYAGVFALVFSVWRIVDIVATTVRFTLFDRHTNAGTIQPTVASHSRIVILALINYVELVVAFGVIYAGSPDMLKPPMCFATDWAGPLYFSAVTQFTIGYGDISPIGWMRYIIVLQGAAALLLLVLLIGRFVSILKPEKELDER